MACHNAIWEHAERLLNAEQNPDHLAVEAIAAELTNHGRYDDPSRFVAVRPRPRACSSDARGMTSIPPCINDRLRQPHRIGKTELVAAGDLYEPEQPQFLR